MTALDDILNAEREIRNLLCNWNVTEIMIPRAFRMEQVGLRAVMVDRLGRFWDVSENPIRMIFDPLGRSPQKEQDHG